MLKLVVVSILMTSHFFGLSVGHTPTTMIRADHSSELDLPEAVGFTPSGDYVAAANAHSITFYKRIGEQGGVYETTPSFCIKGPESQLNYPHDLSFSPDGTRLAVANRKGNSITIYRKNPSMNCYDSTPIAIIQGGLSQLAHPDAVKYSPVENTIVVANMDSSTLLFYRYYGDHYNQLPYQVILSSSLKVPDGLDFSKDGQLLAVTSHGAHSVILYQKMDNSQGLYEPNPVQILQGEETHFCYPHSLAFHPFKNYLAVSSSQGRKNLNIFTKKTESSADGYSNAPEVSLEILEMYDESTIALLDQLWQQGGVKGVAFSPDGKSLAITQNLSQEMLQSTYSVGVLAIYPLND